MKRRLLSALFVGCYVCITYAQTIPPSVNNDRASQQAPYAPQPSAAVPSQSQMIAPGDTPAGLDACAWQSIQTQMRMGKFKAYPNAKGGFSSANLTHGFQIAYGKDGSTTLTPRNWQEVDYHVSMRLIGLGYEDMLSVENPEQLLHTDLGQEGGSKVSYQWNKNLTEWWVNDAQRLEQWFYLREAPGVRCAEEPLRLQLALDTDMQVQQRGSRLTLQKNKTTLTYDKLRVWDATGKEISARMHWNGTYLDLLVDDTDATYPLLIDPAWTQQAYLKASNTGSFDQFGWSVAIDGETIVVGARLEGTAYVFVRSGDMWSQQAFLKASNANSDDQFGWSVAISGETIVVGARLERSNAMGVNGDQSDNSASEAGAAYVFVRNSGMWSQQAYLKASNTGSFDKFGESVAISGETIVVGAGSEDSNAMGVNGDQTDNSVQEAGAAYVFVRNSGMWSQQAYLKASNTGSFDLFGGSVAISGETIVVGAVGEDSNAMGVNGDQTDNSASGAGAAYVFVRNGGMWSQQAYLKASNADSGDQFSISVAIDGETIVVGAWTEDSNATGVNGDQTNNSASSAGAAYVFVRNSGMWSQQAYLKASNTGSFDLFGFSVAIDGETIVVGARDESSNATGGNGDQTNNSASGAGATYVFVRNGGMWSQQAYLKASNTDGSDQFSRSVAISGETIVVGAPLEDSNANGINGNQSDNSASDAGAAYVFILSDIVCQAALSGDATICASGTANLIVNITDGVGQYTVEIDNNGDMSADITVNNYNSGDNIPVAPSATTTYTLLSVIDNGSGNAMCEVSGTATVTVNAVNGGSIGSDQTICSQTTPQAFTSQTDGSGDGDITYRWEMSTTDCNSGFTAIANTNSATYAPGALTQTTYFRRVTISTLNGVACEAISDCVTVTVNDVDGGSIGSDQTICSGATPIAFTSATDGSGDGDITYRWEMSTTDCSTGFSAIANTNSATYAPGALTQTTYFRRVTISTLNGVACEAISDCVTVTVNDVDGGSIGSDQTICSGATPIAFTSATDGSGDGDITYRWEQSTTDCSSGFTAIANTNSATYAPGALTQTTYFRRVTISTLNGVACEDISNCVTVTVNDVDGGAIADDQTVCSGATPAAFTSATDGSGDGDITYRWEMSTTDCSSGFTAIANTNSATYAPGALTQTTYFRRVTISDLNGVLCEATSNCVTVTVNDVTAGSIGSDQTICSGATPAAFTSATDGAGDGDITYRWEQSTTDCSSGFTAIANTNSATYAPGALTQTTYFRRVTISDLNGVLCEAISNCVTVTVNDCGTITIIKEATPKDGTDFNFTTFATQGTQLGNFSLDDDDDPTLSNMKTFVVEPVGFYGFFEEQLAGWKLNNLVNLQNEIIFQCVSDLNGPFTPDIFVVAGSSDAVGPVFEIAAGENITCIFENCKLPTFGGVSVNTVCTGKKATVTLTGLNPNTPLEVTYTLGSDDPVTVTLTSGNDGTATFETRELNYANDNGASLVLNYIDFADDANSCFNNRLSNNTTTVNVLNVDCGEFPWRGNE